MDIFFYLFCYVHYALGLDDSIAIADFIASERESGGTRKVYDYVVTEAAKKYIDKNKIEVGELDEFMDAIDPCSGLGPKALVHVHITSHKSPHSANV